MTLYYPGLYAGATDVVGMYGGREAIIDFKQTNKPSNEWIEDYFVQLAAYAIPPSMTPSQSELFNVQQGLFSNLEVHDEEFQGICTNFT